VLRFLDTDICVAFLRGSSTSLQDHLLQFPKNTIRLPAIVVAELLYGLKKSQAPRRHAMALRQFIGSFQIAGFTQHAAAHYGRIRAALESRGQPIGADDYVVAATVIAEKGILVTGNVKGFKRVPRLRLENWLTK
jgi:tRNA(fMet)-specific endonuclease VapC